jgi:DNA-binding transcriptional MerR regulator
MKGNERSLSVKAVSRLSGLSPHTLRAWERRYGVVEPGRSPNGRRVYSMADVEKLSLLGKLTQLGHSIGNLAPLAMKELSSLEGRSEQQLASARAAPSVELGTVQTEQELLNALRALDLDEVDRRLLQARLATPVRSFVLEVAAPLMKEVGELVAHGKLGISQEHALSAILRNHLGELLAQSRRAGLSAGGSGLFRPALVFSTPEGDLHEFGILLAAILANARGFRSHYLGPNLPPSDLAQTTLKTSVRIVVLGCVEAAAQRLVRPLKEYVRLLAKQLAAGHPQGLEVWIGGHCDFDPQGARLAVPVFHIPSLPEFDARLECAS